MKNYFLLTLSSCFILGFTFAKPCPTSGSTLLDDTYPVKAFVVSATAEHIVNSRDSAEMPSRFIADLAESYNYKDIPDILIPTNDEVFKKVQVSLKMKLEAKLSPEEVQEVLARLKQVPTEIPYKWHQDYFESFVDLKTGTPELRRIEIMTRGNTDATEGLPSADATKRLANSVSGISLGETLKSIDRTSDDLTDSGELGGNIEGLPGGLCLVGNNQSSGYARQFCKDDKNIVKVDVNWLTVGHVDEIFKVIPTKIQDGRPPECNFALMTASPNKALELLENPRVGNSKFFNLEEAEGIQEYRDQSFYSRTVRESGSKICDLVKTYIVPERAKLLEQENEEQSMPQEVKEAFLNLIIPMSHAKLSIKRKEKHCSKELPEVTNREMINAIKQDKELIEYNRLVQESINNSIDKIKDSILERLPQCRNYFKTIEVPDLFFGGPLVELEDGAKELPQPGNGHSLLPNPTNSVIANDTIIFPDPQNNVFGNYIEAEMEKNRLKVKRIETWDYAHVGQGNLHCTSHSIPWCDPKKD